MEDQAVFRISPHKGFGEPGPNVIFTSRLSGAELVDGESRRHRAEKCSGVFNIAGVCLLPTKESLLHDVLRVGHRSEHSVGDRKNEFLISIKRVERIHIAAFPCSRWQASPQKSR